MGKGIYAIHLNIRSLIPKIDQLRAWLVYNKPDIITISESWLSESISDSDIKLENFLLGLTESLGVEVSLPIFHQI